MCLILFAYQAHPNYPLVVAANRDEFYQRPARKASFWPEAPDLLAGKDLQQQGAWLGITKTGRFATVTNYREMTKETVFSRSRGALTYDFLMSDDTPRQYLGKLNYYCEEFNGFGLLVGDVNSLYFFSNKTKKIVEIKPGIYGLSNHLLDTPWPKVHNGKQALQTCVSDGINASNLQAILADNQQAPDDQLPRTGVPLEIERLLSSCFIQSPTYGTRASTVLIINSMREVEFCEQNYCANGVKGENNRFQFLLD